MTERGTRARWTAAALVAPVAAAVFTGTTVWAAENQPVTAAAPAATTAAPAEPTADPAVVKLRKEVAKEKRKIAALTKKVTNISKKAAALAAGGSSSGTSTRSYSTLRLGRFEQRFEQQLRQQEHDDGQEDDHRHQARTQARDAAAEQHHHGCVRLMPVDVRSERSDLQHSFRSMASDVRFWVVRPGAGAEAAVERARATVETVARDVHTVRPHQRPDACQRGRPRVAAGGAASASRRSCWPSRRTGRPVACSTRGC